MVARTASSDAVARPSARLTGWLSLLFGFVAVVVLPAAIATSERTDRYSLLEAGFAAPPAAVFGLLAILLGRRGRRRQRVALAPGPGGRAARAGRLLGWLGVYLAATAGAALGVYWLETYLAD